MTPVQRAAWEHRVLAAAEHMRRTYHGGGNYIALDLANERLQNAALETPVVLPDVVHAFAALVNVVARCNYLTVLGECETVAEFLEKGQRVELLLSGLASYALALGMAS